jgi:hypothetical protein
MSPVPVIGPLWSFSFSLSVSHWLCRNVAAIQSMVQAARAEELAEVRKQQQLRLAEQQRQKQEERLAHFDRVEMGQYANLFLLVPFAR